MTGAAANRLAALVNPPGLLPDGLIPDPPRGVRRRDRARWRERFRASVSAYCLTAAARRALRLERGMAEPEQWREMRRCLAGEEPWPDYVAARAMGFKHKRGTRSRRRYLRQIADMGNEHERRIAARGLEY